MDRQRARTCPPGGDPGAARPTRATTRRIRAAGAIASAALVVAAVVTGVSTAGATTTAGVTTRGAAVHVLASSVPTPALVLQSQTGWVTGGSTFDLHLRVATTTVPASRLGITVAVYPCLSSISGFDQSTTSSSLGTPVSSTTSALPITSLPALPGGAVDLRMPVVVGNGASGGTPAPGPFTIHLLAVGGQCQLFPAGVFPLRIELVDMSGPTVVSSFTTHLVYSEAPSTTQRLRVAVVLPVQITQSASRSPSPSALLARPSAALATPPDPTVAAVSATVASIATQHPTVPLTLSVSGQTVGLLDSPAHQATITQLGQLAAAPDVHQLTTAPFTPVDATSLVDGGLSDELALQVARGLQVVGTALNRPAPTAPPGQTPDLGTWITGGGLDATTVAALVDDGYHHVVLPASQLSSSPGVGSTTVPFTLSTVRGNPVTAVASDDDLTARFSADPGNPVLAAHQLAAELAQIYYEQPNGNTPRAVLAVAPTGWADDPSFVGALLDALDGNPLVQAVTTDQLFALFPTPATCRSGCRLTPTGGQGLPVGAIRDQRIQVNGFAVSTVGARALTLQLSDLVLAGEAETLRSGQQQAVLANAGAAVSAQFGQLAVESDQTVTLTAHSGRVPVTIVSTAPYPVTATLALSSDKLLFPNGQTQWSRAVVLQPRISNVVNVQVQSRASGVFRMDVTLHAPSGPVRLAAGELTVRSTSSSVVGVALTVGAVAVLMVWWFRTSRRRRAAQRSERGSADEDGTGEPGPATTVGGGALSGADSAGVAP